MSDTTHHQIVKTSLVSGAARIVTILATVLRSKAVAIYSGTEGVGLFGIISSALSFLVSLLTCGLETSGSRAIAASSQNSRIARISYVLRVLCWLMGFAGFLVCMVFSGQLNMCFLGGEGDTLSVAIVATAIPVTTASIAHITILRGMARVRTMAIQGIVASAISLIATYIILKTLRGHLAIVTIVLVSATITLLTSWFLERRTTQFDRETNTSGSLRLSGPLLKSGFIYMLSSAVSAGGALFVSMQIKSQGGLHENGIYQAAWAVSISLTGLMLSGMGNDFYPKLTRLISSGQDSASLLRKQTEVGVLLSLPALLALSLFSEQAVQILYSNEFSDSAKIVPILVLGCFGRVVSWPIAYLLMAKGRARTFLFTETMTVGLHIIMVILTMPLWGLKGVAMSFGIVYILYGFGMSWLAERIGHSSPIRYVVIHAAIGYIMLLLVLLVPREIGVVLLLAASLYTVYSLRLGSGFANWAARRLSNFK